MTAPESRFPFRGCVLFTALLGVLSCSLLMSACASLALQSGWMDSGTDPVAWRGALIPLGERDASLAVQNDDNALRVSFITTDQDLQGRILKQGIFIWFDPNGGESRRFGIRYPLAWSSMPASLDGAPHPEETSPGSPGTGWGRPGDDLEVYTDGYKEYERIGKKDAGGIVVEVEKFSDTLLCRLRVPFLGNAGGPYALNAAPGGLIGVGIETRANRTTGESIGSILPFQVWRTVQLARRSGMP